MTKYLVVVGVAVVTSSAHGGFVDLIDSPVYAEAPTHHAWVVVADTTPQVSNITFDSQVDVVFEAEMPAVTPAPQVSSNAAPPGMSWGGIADVEQNDNGVLDAPPFMETMMGDAAGPSWSDEEPGGRVAHAPLPSALGLGLLGLVGVIVLRRFGTS